MGQDAGELVAPDPGNLVLFDRALSEVAQSTTTACTQGLGWAI